MNPQALYSISSRPTTDGLSPLILFIVMSLFIIYFVFIGI